MKYLLSGTLIAAVAMTSAAMAFGPGYQSKQQFAQSDSQYQMQGRGPGRGQGRRMGRGRRMNTDQTQPQQYANRGNRTGEPVFVDSWDDDEDGVVSLAEAKERRGEFFGALDDNEDGKIDSKEFAEFMTNQKMPADEATNGQRGLFGMTLSFNDVNKDGAVTKEEFLAQTQKWLDGMDRSGDGKVSKDDFGPRNGQMASNGQRRGQGRGQGRGMGRRWQQQSQ